MKRIILILLVGIVMSCSTTLDKKYNEDTLKIDAKEIKESGELDGEEIELLAGWLMRSKLKGENLEGKTYNEIIKEAKDNKIEQDDLVKKVKHEEENKRQRLGASLTVAMYDKGFEKYDYQEYLTYSLAFENKTDKDIRAFKESLSINDLFDTEIKSINLTIDEPINAGQIYKGTYTTDYNRFTDDDVRLKGKEINDLKIIWTPEKIIFGDGSTLE